MGRSGRRIQEFKQFVVRDDACGMKVGTDALILGSWAGAVRFPDPQSPLQILDIGTGSGILALMLAQRFPQARVDAIELEPDAAAQAVQNAFESPFNERIAVHGRAFQGWEGSADLIVCNPPFFHNHPKSVDRKRNLARHDDTLPLKALFRSVKGCLSEKGEFAMVFPEDRAEELREVAQGQGFHGLACIQLRATPEHEVIRSLWSWGLQPAEELKDVWEVEGEEGQGAWSQRLAAMLAPFVSV